MPALSLATTSSLISLSITHTHTHLYPEIGLDQYLGVKDIPTSSTSSQLPSLVTRLPKTPNHQTTQHLRASLVQYTVNMSELRTYITTPARPIAVMKILYHYLRGICG